MGLQDESLYTWKGYNASGSQFSCYDDGTKPCASPRQYFRVHVAPRNPDDMLSQDLPPTMEHQTIIKYMLHLDGLACSTRLLHYLGNGMTTFVEQVRLTGTHL